jgi:hypothetical protein
MMERSPRAPVLRSIAFLAMAPSASPATVDPVRKTERTTLVFEAIGDDKVRIGCSSWDHPVVILPNEALEVMAIENTLYVTRRALPAEYLNIDPSGMVEAGYGPELK